MAFRVLNDTYVTNADGTGIVHQAPTFGDDDHHVLLAHDVIAAEESPPCPTGGGRRFTSEVTDFVGQHVKVRTLDFASPCQSPCSRLKGRR
jgi:isoleucyl-tRNA synthetase